MIFVFIFLIVIAISLFLAYRSMRDYIDIPSIEKNGVFLIQKPEIVTEELINRLHNLLKGEIVSFERLFKGSQSALVIFGPKSVLQQFPELNLLELEDYVKVESPKIAWEMGFKNGVAPKEVGNIFENLPELEINEQYWWQLALQSDKDQGWQSIIRAVFVSQDESRRRELSSKLQNLPPLVKIPKPLTPEQIYENYTKRSFGISQNPFKVTSNLVLRLLGRG